jgi:hypothetical protein
MGIAELQHTIASSIVLSSCSLHRIHTRTLHYQIPSSSPGVKQCQDRRDNRQENIHNNPHIYPLSIMMLRHSRRLEDDYSSDDGVEYPHWLSQAVWIILLIFIVLSVYQLHYRLYQSRAFRNMFAGARSATEDLVATTDDFEAEAVSPTSPSPPWTSTKGEMAPPRKNNHNEYVNMPTTVTDLRDTGVSA